MRYEDFVADPEEVLGWIYDFVGLDRRGMSERVWPNVNDKYFEQWEQPGSLLGWGKRRLTGAWFEPRVRPFGYSFSSLRE